MEDTAVPDCTGVIVFPVGEGMLVLQTPPQLQCQQRLWQLADALRASGWQPVLGVYHLGLSFDPLVCPADEASELLLAGWQQAEAVERASAVLHLLPVTYGGAHGPDLDVVAECCGLSPAEVIERHAAAEYQVYCLGFLPGFPYLGGMDPLLATPRRAEPRLCVPAGSVGIGGGQTGIYPQAAPGGWQLIGRSSSRLFNPARDPVALLQPGDRVRFVPEQASCR
ncbi:5-oxoprolinase subunit PxpB [Chitinilyticum aquatile]|uniref:5-oxoprolinase subunit PxpB n=1 Tax=Chitinilyticum aquatile TaxID=362520 RepID=UPI0003F4E2B6|nr:5-oxoprolinase subunit PxpB [Chitinilyticum aquatile]